MALVNAVLTRDVAGQPRGTIFEVDENDPRIRRGTLEVTKEKAPEEVDTSDVDAMKGPELREQLENLGLDSKGRISELKDRLRTARGGRAAEVFDFHHAEPGAGSEEPGEVVTTLDAANEDLVNQDESDKVEGRQLFAGDPGKHPWGLDTKLGNTDDDGDPTTDGDHRGNELFAGDVTQDPGKHPLEVDTRIAPTADQIDAGF